MNTLVSGKLSEHVHEIFKAYWKRQIQTVSRIELGPWPERKKTLYIRVMVDGWQDKIYTTLPSFAGADISAAINRVVPQAHIIYERFQRL